MSGTCGGDEGEAMGQGLYTALAVVHALTSALWLGAMTFSLLVVQPRAKRLLGEGFEELARVLAAGARWPVLGALMTIGVSGAGMAVLRWHANGGWLGLMAVKAVAWVLAGGLFAYVSWGIWPRRIFAIDEELIEAQRRVRRVGMVLTVVAGVAFVLGVVARSL